MQQTTKRKRNVKPVTGSCRWVKPLLLPFGLGRLAITSETKRGPVTNEYDIGCHLGERNRILGYRLVKDDDEGYDLDASGEHWTCTCADFLYTRENRDPKGCKHIAGTQAAVKKCHTQV